MVWSDLYWQVQLGSLQREHETDNQQYIHQCKESYIHGTGVEVREQI